MPHTFLSGSKRRGKPSLSLDPGTPDITWISPGSAPVMTHDGNGLNDTAEQEHLMVWNSETFGESESVVHAAVRDGRLDRLLSEDPRTAEPALYNCVAGVVYERLTRGIERGRGHYSCAISARHLEPECHDAFDDDVAAVREELLRNSTRPIANLHGWLVRRLRPATVDAHRRRRGACGAAQRPRLPLPRWLDAALGGDPWLRELSVLILTWVGVPTAAPDGLWPLVAWADRRGAATGEYGYGEIRTAADIERVLSAMRTNPAWFQRYVEGPLGFKQPSVSSRPSDHSDAESLMLPGLRPDEVADAQLLELAAASIEAIEVCVARGEALEHAVPRVLAIAFGSGTGAADLDRLPGTSPTEDERVARLLLDPARVDRVVAAVRDILAIG